MTDREPSKAELDRLRSVLAAYGADSERWPAADRALAGVLAEAELAAHLADARAIDSALALASRPVAPAGAADRLIAASGRGSAAIVPLARRHEASLPGRLAVLTALAAALALGLYLGATGQTDWLAPPLLAEDQPEYLSADFDVIDGTLQLFEDQVER